MMRSKNVCCGYAKVIVALLSCLSTLNSFAAIRYINTNDPQCSDQRGGPYCHLQAAIKQSKKGDVLQLASGLYEGGISVDKNLIIQGAGAAVTIIDGGGQAAGISIVANTEVTIKGVTIQNGLSENGGGISNYGHLDLSDCIVKKNIATLRGGGIYSGGPENAKLAISNCIISQNQALGDDKYNVKFGGGGIYNGGVLLISETRIVDNIAKENGGGIYSVYAGTKKIKESVVILSKLGFYAGSVLNKRLGEKFNLDDVRITRSMISGNRADNGGGINVHSALRMQHSTVSNNVAEGSGISAGGGIFAHFDAHLDLVNSTFSGNFAEFRGGAIRFYSRAASRLSFVTIANNTVGKQGSGAGVYVIESSAELSIYHVLFANNFGGDKVDVDCIGEIQSLGYNLVNAKDERCKVTQYEGDRFGTTHEPLQIVLLPLQHNGGYTKTHGLPKNSLAIDQGKAGLCGLADEEALATDQRGNVRPFGGDSGLHNKCDIGAFEVSDPKPS